MRQTTHIGKRVNELRKRKKLTLKNISEQTGLSISFLSQLEHGKTSATLESLKKISESLDVNPSYFFLETDNDSRSTITRNTVSTANLTENRFIYKNLSGGIKDPAFIPNLIILDPGTNRGNNFSHKGQEFLFVLEGTLTIEVDNYVNVLHPYDCVFLDSSKPHYWFNKTDKPIKFLCISTND